MSKRIIDPNDPLHDSVEKTLAGLSPKERAARLNEMFDKPSEAVVKPESSQPSAESDSERAKRILGLDLSPAEIELAKALGYL